MPGLRRSGSGGPLSFPRLGTMRRVFRLNQRTDKTFADAGSSAPAVSVRFGTADLAGKTLQRITGCHLPRQYHGASRNYHGLR